MLTLTVTLTLALALTLTLTFARHDAILPSAWLGVPRVTAFVSPRAAQAATTGSTVFHATAHRAL